MNQSILVFNAGSSSVKYVMIDTTDETTIASGLVERVGRPDAVLHHRFAGGEATVSVSASDHTAAVRAVMDAFDAHGPDLSDAQVAAVGHRVVMGGRDLYAPVVITDEILAAIDSLAPLAPLHNPANAAAIRIARTLLPGVPHVAVFDTAFFHDLPPQAAHYAIAPDLADTNGIRRYGFHGISHEYVSQTVVETLTSDAGGDRFGGRPVAADGLRQVVLHLGNGASASAVVGSSPVETSMGLTPLEGLVMGTRSGDIDPAVGFYLHRHLDMSIDDIDHFLNFESGLVGLTGTNDMRDIRKRVTDDDPAARSAVDIYVHRLRKYVGAYAAVMGGLDALTFTAGVGENDHVLRAEVTDTLGFLGVELDPEENAKPADGPRVISTPKSNVVVLVVPTKEELSISRQVASLLETV